MSVSRDCKVTFRKEAYSGLSINQDETGKITSRAAWSLGTYIHVWGIKRSSPTQPQILSYAFCLARTDSPTNSTIVNSLEYSDYHTSL